jgi:predicted transposase YdaD
MSFIARQDSPDRTKKGSVFLPCLLYSLVLLVLSTQASKKPTPVRPTSLGIGVLKLMIQNESQAINSAKILIERISTEIAEPQTQRNVINLIESIIIYKLPLKNREEIEAMFELQDLKKTRFYQEALGEGKLEGMQEGEVLGRQKGEANLVIRLLNRRFGEIPQNLREKILAMSVEQLENLGESLLDFESLSDLVNWLDR